MLDNQTLNDKAPILTRFIYLDVRFLDQRDFANYCKRFLWIKQESGYMFFHIFWFLGLQQKLYE